MKYDSVSFQERNTYVVYDENTKNGVIIDPGCSMEKIEALIQKNGVNVKYILLTHCHYDHIMSADELRKKTSAKILCGDRASKNISNPDINLSVEGLGYKIDNLKEDGILKDGEIINIDGFSVKCIYTPGHTDCCVCYLVGNDIFCGDTLFLRSCGRWDLPTGNFEALEKSVKEKLYTLPDETVTHSGHGYESTIGYEKKKNFYIQL